MTKFNALNPEIDTSLAHRYLYLGVPTRTSRMPPFLLKSVLQDAVISDSQVHTRKKQVEQYGYAYKDDPGWFMIIQSPQFLDNARHIAANILHSYQQDELTAGWYTSFFKDPPGGKNLYVFDTLFSDDVPSRRSRIFEILLGLNSPSSSVILLSRSPDLPTAVHQIGLKPHIMLSTLR